LNGNAQGDSMTMPEDIAARIKQMLESMQEPVLAPFLADWPATDRHRSVVASDLPVLRWFPEFAGDAGAFGMDLVAAVHRAAPSLAWRQTYTANDVGGAFLDNYAWSEIFGGHGPLVSTRIACGFLILGPSTHYPRHRHEAEEMYLPLSGTAAWQQGDAAWRDRPPGTLIHHASDEPHAMRTGGNPLLALYLWRSANLEQKALLDRVAN
jgi:Dimethlysulfonioproprionate lyase